MRTRPDMTPRFYNTLSKSVEAFQPIEPGVVRMYTCGPTVYDYAHIGNFRSFLFADLLRRTLELFGNRVHHVMNITDVGHMTDDTQADGGGQDKMALAAERIKQARQASTSHPLESKKAGTAHLEAIADPRDPFQVADFYADAFIEDALALGVKVAREPHNIPRATQHIEQMQQMITTLVDRGHAYVSEAGGGAVYFDVRSFPDYGALSGNTLDALAAGAGGRVSDENQAGKRHHADFLLWKPDETHLMKWDAPWGRGYPGWHIECSAMARAVLGRDVIDIHTGGEDLIFPHHECEIAQSRGATGCQHLARFFMHARFLLVEGEKMSKSKGNFFTVRDVLAGRATAAARAVDPAVLRYALIRGHYRQNMNFTADGLAESAGAVKKLRAAAADIRERFDASPDPPALDHPTIRDFAAALADDLNISQALAVAFDWLRRPRTDPAEAAMVLAALDAVLAVAPLDAHRPPANPDPAAEGVDPAALAARIDAARKAKDFDTADELRQQLIDAGYEVKTTKEGTVAERTLA